MKRSTRLKIDRAANALRALAEHAEDAEPDAVLLVVRVLELHDDLRGAEAEWLSDLRARAA